MAQRNARAHSELLGCDFSLFKPGLCDLVIDLSEGLDELGTLGLGSLDVLRGNVSGSDSDAVAERA